MDTDPWEKAGLYQPDHPGADERLALLEYLTKRGASLEQMVAAHELGGLPGVAGDLVLGRPSPMTSIPELAARCGVTPERVQRVLLASGLPAAADSSVPESLEPLLSAFEQAAALMGEDAILAFTRVMSAAAMNIAEAAVALFYAELGAGAAREGSDEVARARAAETATLAFASVPEVFSWGLMAHFDRARRGSLVTRGGAAAGGATVSEAPSAGPSQVVAIGFVDLVGSTAWAEGLSLRDHSLALSRFESAAWASAVLADGRVVKMIGDEVFFAAPSVESACRIGTEVCRAAAADPLLPPARGAVGYGPVTPREGDYFGPLVNLVSRLVKTARPGGLVATEEAAAALPTDSWTVRALGPQTLKGLERPVPAFDVSPSSARPIGRAIK